MKYTGIMNDTMKMLLEKGADKVSLWLQVNNKEEFNVVFKELNLLRSLESYSFSMVVIKDQKRASTSLNQLDKESIAKAVDELMISLQGANQDPAFDISPYQEPVKKSKGPQEGDLEKVCLRLNELTETMKRDYPSIHFDAIMSYVNETTFYLNSNDTKFEDKIGHYDFMLMFTAKEGNNMSSLNYTFYSTADLDEQLLKKNFAELLVKQSTEQTVTKPIPENFSGEVVLMPFVTAELLTTMLDSHIGNNGLLLNTSRFPDHLNKKILDEKLTVDVRPLDKDMPTSSHIVDDGFIAQNATIIDKGVLKHYLISIYVSNKTGKKRTIGPNYDFSIHPGNSSYKQLISKVKKGILCARLSYGSPNSNGDFSGVLKNSYYIENGEIQYPIRETMMSANLIDMFNNIVDISQETINTGSVKSPFILVNNVYLAKK